MPAFSLGYVNAVPGTPQRITTNQSEPTRAISCGSVMIQVRSTNTGLVYVGLSNMDKTTGVGLLAILGVPSVNYIPSYSVGNPNAAAGFSAPEFFIDSTSSTNGVLSAYVR